MIEKWGKSKRKISNIQLYKLSSKLSRTGGQLSQNLVQDMLYHTEIKKKRASSCHWCHLGGWPNIDPSSQPANILQQLHTSHTGIIKTNRELKLWLVGLEWTMKLKNYELCWKYEPKRIISFFSITSQSIGNHWHRPLSIVGQKPPHHQQLLQLDMLSYTTGNHQQQAQMLPIELLSLLQLHIFQLCT